MKTATSISKNIISYFGQISEIFENTAENSLQTDVDVDISHSATFESDEKVDIYLSNKIIFYFTEDLVKIKYKTPELAKSTYEELIKILESHQQ